MKILGIRLQFKINLPISFAINYFINFETGQIYIKDFTNLQLNYSLYLFSKLLKKSGKTLE